MRGGVCLNLSYIYHPISLYPLYRTPNLIEHPRRISISTRKHTASRIILLHKLFLLKRFFPHFCVVCYQHTLSIIYSSKIAFIINNPFFIINIYFTIIQIIFIHQIINLSFIKYCIL